MKGSEFEGRAKQLAKTLNLTCHFVADQVAMAACTSAENPRPQRSEEGSRPRPAREDVPGSRHPSTRPVRRSNALHDLSREIRQRPDGRVLVVFPDLPRVATDGKDHSEAMEEAMDALGSDLSIRLSRREEIPEPSLPKRGHRLIPVPFWLAPKLALFAAMRDQGVSNSELARRLGVHERVIRRMLDPAHASKPARIQAALAALGKQLSVEVGDAA